MLRFEDSVLLVTSPSSLKKQRIAVSSFQMLCLVEGVIKEKNILAF